MSSEPTSTTTEPQVTPGPDDVRAIPVTPAAPAPAHAPNGAQMAREGLSLVARGTGHVLRHAATSAAASLAARRTSITTAATARTAAKPAKAVPVGAGTTAHRLTPMRKRAERMALWAIVFIVAYMTVLAGPIHSVLEGVARATSPTVHVVYVPVPGQQAHPAPAASAASK